MVRMRSRAELREIGTAGYWWNPTLISSGGLGATSLAEKCTDDHPSSGGGVFRVTRKTTSGGQCTRTDAGATNDFRANNFVLDGFRDFWPMDVDYPDAPSDAEAANRALVNSNPSRSSVDLPVAIFELRELPRLIKSIGDAYFRRRRRVFKSSLTKAGKDAAAAYLEYEFGIGQLIRDLIRLSKFQDAYDKRVKELERLNSRGTVTRAQMWTGQKSGSFPIVPQSNGTFLEMTLDWKSEASVWTWVKWTPILGMPVTDAELSRQARNAILGLTLDSATLWNALPWTWLFDWCSSVGDWFAIHRNIVGATPSPVLVMRHHVIKQHSPGFGPTFNGYTVTDWFAMSETKERSPRNASLTAGLPFLDDRQFSILSAIAVTRRDKRPRL